MVDYVGRILNDRYKVDALIGKGGMGFVYRGRHAIIGRKVAIKFLKSEFVGNEQLVTRFYREAQAAAAIGHKNIIDVMDVGISEENEPYLVMEYLEGESLANLLSRTGPMELAAACGILEPVLNGLSAAHNKGIVHRDLKPENIFLVHNDEEDSISVKIIDFGITKIIKEEEQQKLTQAGATIGTPSYMAPEQAKGDLMVDHRADIYSIGVIMYEMLTGEKPFKDDNYFSLLAKIITEPPPSPVSINPHFPHEATKVIDRAMAKDRDDRYASVGELLAALDDLTTSEDRRSQMSLFASSIAERRGAMGDIGDVESDGAGSGARRGGGRQREPIKATPGVWSSSSPEPSHGTFDGLRQKSFWAISIGSGLVTGLLVVVIFLLNRPPSALPKVAQPVGEGVTAKGASSAPLSKPIPGDQGTGEASRGTLPSEREDQVRISLNGVPIGAIIRVDGTSVSSNPFSLEKGPAPVRIEVVSSGYEPFETEVVPNGDQTLDVSLVLAGSADRSVSSETAQRRPRKDKKTSKGDSERPKLTIREGKRGTLIVEDFE